MTVEQIKASEQAFLNAADVAEVLGCDPHSIRVMAHSKPTSLGFPVTVCNRRVMIPRKPFLKFIGEM